MKIIDFINEELRLCYFAWKARKCMKKMTVDDIGSAIMGTAFLVPMIMLAMYALQYY